MFMCCCVCNVLMLSNYDDDDCCSKSHKFNEDGENVDRAYDACIKSDGLVVWGE